MGHIRKLSSGTKRWQVRWTDPSGHEKAKAFVKKSDAEKHLTAATPCSSLAYINGPISVWRMESKQARHPDYPTTRQAAWSHISE